MKIRCRLCDKMDDPEEFIEGAIRSRMENHKICFHCAFWFEIKSQDEDLLKNHTHRIPIIYEDEQGRRCHAIIPKISLESTCNIPDTCKSNILLRDGSILRWTINYTFQGIIPTNFYDYFPINAKILSESQKVQLINRISLLKGADRNVPSDIVEKIFNE